MTVIAKGQKVPTMRNSGNQTDTGMRGLARAIAAMCAAIMLSVSPAYAQGVESFDPDEAFETATETASGAANSAAADATSAAGAIDADLVDPALRSNVPNTPVVDPTVPAPFPNEVTEVPGTVNGTAAGQTGFDDEFAQYSGSQIPNDATNVATASGDSIPGDAPAQASADTYGQDDLIGAAEGVFGKGAQGLAGLIEDLLREQGEPNGYIVGREGGGAFIFGVRYGSGTLHHRIEGQRKLYWTGPSLGFDAGANAGNTFVLVYNLFDTQDIFRRYPAGEGQAYFVGGMHASYMRRGDVVLIPIRVGAGLRLGVNAGYMRFSEKHRWLPF